MEGCKIKYGDVKDIFSIVDITDKYLLVKNKEIVKKVYIYEVEPVTFLNFSIDVQSNILNLYSEFLHELNLDFQIYISNKKINIQKYISNLEDQHPHIQFEFFNLGKDIRMYEKYEIVLFRLAQEALQNAITHGQASIIIIRIEIRKDNTSLVVQDNGVGFDTDKKKEKSFGLIGMRERVDMFKGEFSVTSQKGQGTRVFVKLPFSKETTDSDMNSLPKID